MPSISTTPARETEAEKASKAPWPKHPDGRSKTMGEMTPNERRTQWKGAVERFKERCAAVKDATGAQS